MSTGKILPVGSSNKLFEKLEKAAFEQCGGGRSSLRMLFNYFPEKIKNSDEGKRMEEILRQKGIKARFEKKVQTRDDYARVPSMFVTREQTQAKLNFEMLRMSHFPIHIFSGALFGYAGCGPNIMGLLTGCNPLDISRIFNESIKQKFPENNSIVESDDGFKHQVIGTPPELIADFLAVFGIRMLPITLSDVCPSASVALQDIPTDVMVLEERHLAKEQLSWFLCYNKMRFHNGEISTNKPHYYDHILRPLGRCYVLFHPMYASHIKEDATSLDQLIQQFNAEEEQ